MMLSISWEEIDLMAMAAKRPTKISQSSGPIPLAADETVIKEWEDRIERVATTASSLEAEQDSGNINRTQSMATLNKSFPQGTDLGSGPRKAKRPTEISQSSGPIPLVADETVIKEWEDRMERDATTASSLEAKQDSEAQIRFQAASKQFNDPPLLRVNTLRSGEDNIKLKELMEFCTKICLKGLICDLKIKIDEVVRKRNERYSEPEKQKRERELVRVKIRNGNAFWNEIGVNAGVLKLMLLSLNLLLPVLVNAAKLKLNAASISNVARHKLTTAS
ncbi:hypothetical protein Tco_1166791 [Tanacetum coccineum]